MVDQAMRAILLNIQDHAQDWKPLAEQGVEEFGRGALYFVFGDVAAAVSYKHGECISKICNSVNGDKSPW